MDSSSQRLAPSRPSHWLQQSPRHYESSQRLVGTAMHSDALPKDVICHWQWARSSEVSRCCKARTRRRIHLACGRRRIPESRICVCCPPTTSGVGIRSCAKSSRLTVVSVLRRHRSAASRTQCDLKFAPQKAEFPAAER